MPFLAAFETLRQTKHAQFHTFDCSEAYSEPSEISKMENFAKIIGSFWPLTIFTISFILDT